jgi:hypothetical protein
MLDPSSSVRNATGRPLASNHTKFVLLTHPFVLAKPHLMTSKGSGLLLPARDRDRHDAPGSC